jgi:hypothetical protein
MKNLLRLEELAQFLIALGFLIAMKVDWWYYPLLLVGPDISMLGYLVNPRVGAACYNVFHHKAVAILVVLAAIPLSGDLFEVPVYMIPGIILYGHASMDRIFGYGLKFGDNFHHTHLGWIGKLSKKEEVG